MPLLLAILVSILAILAIAPLRRTILTGPFFRFVKKNAPKISPIEKQAIEAGSTGFDAELFTGKPNWDAFRSNYKLELTKEEQDFIDGPTQEFCSLINDWEIRGKKREVTNEVWDFAKKHGFLALRVPKKYGGHGFSTQAKSIILTTIASRSFDASTTVAVPNSLGPDELLETYGTQEQKDEYLEAFASGKEIPCFAITSANAGSDAASMRDVGRVVRKKYLEKETLGVELTFSKRYITLAPEATVVLLAFRLTDPDHLLSGKEDRGITLAIIPASHNGINIGRRHLPGGSVFPNGPISGENVFIPIDWVLGGESGIGQGWKMAMHNLAAGRGISLPSLSVAAIQKMLLVSSAYARVRRQFNKPIGYIEGVMTPLVRIIESAYLSEAGRMITASMTTSTHRPVVIASIMKYQTTERARQSINDAMDIHGGKAIIDGPNNYMQSAYQMAPVGITVEGANIITRSLMVMGQAALCSHPYFKSEAEAFEDNSIKKFDQALLSHMFFFISNLFLAVFHNLTGGTFARAGKKTPGQTKRWYRIVAHASARFAFLADTLILTHKDKLKKRQHVSGRLADLLSELYLLSCVLKKFEDDGLHAEDYPLLLLSMQNGLYRFESSVNSIVQNTDNTLLRWLLRLVIGTWVHAKQPASDKLQSQVAQLVLNQSGTRSRLTPYVYIPKNINEPIKLLEEAMCKSIENDSIIEKIEQAFRSGKLARFQNSDWIQDAKSAGIINDEESSRLQETEKLIEQVISVDDFNPNEIHGIF